MNFKTGILLFFAILNISFGLLVYSKNRKSISNIAYCLFMSSVGIWSFGLSMFYFIPAERYSIFWSNFVYFMGSSIAVAFFYVSLTLVDGKQIKKQLFIWPLISLGILFILYFFSPLMINGIYYPNAVKTFIYGPAHLLFDIHFSTLFILAIFRLFRALKITSGIKREQVKYVLLSTFIGVVFNGATNVTMPSIFHNCSLVWIGPYITFVMVSIMTYAIVKYRILDVHFVIRGGVVNTVIAICLTGIILLAFLLIPGITLKSIVIFLIMFFTAMYLPEIKKRTENVIIQILYKEKYKHRDRMEKFIEDIVLILEKKDLLEKIHKTSAETLGTKKVAVFTYDNVLGDYELSAQTGLDEVKGLRIPGNTGIAGWLKKHKEVFIKEETEKVLEKTELLLIRETLDKLSASICIPALLKTDLLGIITLGEKESGEMYSHLDTEILRRLGDKIAVALDYKRDEAELRKKQEYEAIGQLAFEITHEMKNLLVPINTLVQMLPEKLNDPEFISNMCRLSKTNVNAINRKVEDILYFGQEQKLDLSAWLDINKLLSDTAEGLRPLAQQDNIPIVEELGDIPKIMADKELLLHVFNNLIMNAIDAMKNRTGKIRIRTQRHTDPSMQMKQISPRWIRIEVKDDGGGIPDNVKDKIFTAFVTTKSGGGDLQKRGMGLGLTIVKKIVDQHHGIVGVNSSMGKGTTFIVDLPVEQRG